MCMSAPKAPPPAPTIMPQKAPAVAKAPELGEPVSQIDTAEKKRKGIKKLARGRSGLQIKGSTTTGSSMIS